MKKYWSYIGDKLSNHITLAIQLLLLVLGIYVFIMAQRHVLWKVPLLFVGLLSWFLFRDKIKYPIVWIVPLMFLLIDLIFSYIWMANHHFMLVFMVLAVIFYTYHKSPDILQKNIQILLVVVILASVVQKLMSSQFMSGEFYYYMINRGTLFTFFINLFPESLEVTKSNYELLKTLHNTDSNMGKSVVVKDVIPNLGKISIVYAWLTVIMEFSVAILLLLKPKSAFTHILFSIMILGILCARFETAFMALLAICGIILCKNQKLRLLFTMIVIGCVTLIVTKIGYH